MFSDDDPLLGRLRDLALKRPGTIEKVSHGRPVFGVPKMFAVYGGSTKNPPGPHIPYPQSLLVKVDDSERAALAEGTRFFRRACFGPYGWLGLDFAAAEIDWTEVAELLDASYRLVAPARLIRQLGS